MGVLQRMLFLLFLNSLSFLLMLWDQHQARRKGWRLAELKLLAPVLLGGPWGVLTAMVVSGHKTRKTTFQIKLLVSSCVWLKFVSGIL